MQAYYYWRLKVERLGMNILSQGSSLQSAPTHLPIKIKSLTTNQTQNKKNTALLDAIRYQDIVSEVRKERSFSWIRIYRLRQMLLMVSVLQSLLIYISKYPSWIGILFREVMFQKLNFWPEDKEREISYKRSSSWQNARHQCSIPNFSWKKEMVDPIS